LEASLRSNFLFIEGKEDLEVLIEGVFGGRPGYRAWSIELPYVTTQITDRVRYLRLKDRRRGHSHPPTLRQAIPDRHLRWQVFKMDPNWLTLEPTGGSVLRYFRNMATLAHKDSPFIGEECIVMIRGFNRKVATSTAESSSFLASIPKLHTVIPYNGSVFFDAVVIGRSSEEDLGPTAFHMVYSQQLSKVVRPRDEGSAFVRTGPDSIVYEYPVVPLKETDALSTPGTTELKKCKRIGFMHLDAGQGVDPCVAFIKAVVNYTDSVCEARWKSKRRR